MPIVVIVEYPEKYSMSTTSSLIVEALRVVVVEREDDVEGRNEFDNNEPR